MDSSRYYLRRMQDILQPYILKGVVPTGRQLGHGAFGSVIEMRMLGGALCAGKKIHDALVNPQNMGVQKMVEKFTTECELMSKMRHPNIVNFYGLAFIAESSAPILVMEHLDRSLNDYLERTQIKDIPFSIRVSILYDVAKGLVFLHSYQPPIIHCDLTPCNILLTNTKQARIADLGNSRIINTENITKTLSQVPGTLLYMPPEALHSKPNYDASLDMFSFGHVSLYTLTHVPPTSLLPATYTDDLGTVLGRSEVERRRPYIDELEANELIPLKICDSVKNCLHNIPQKRPTSNEMAEDLEQLLEGSEEFKRVMKRIENMELAEHKHQSSVASATQCKADYLTFGILSGSPYILEMRTVNRGLRKSVIWRKYMFELVDRSYLKYYSKLNDKRHHVLNLQQVEKIASVEGEPKFHFTIIFSEQKGTSQDIHLRAETKEERKCWIQALCDVIGLQYSKPLPPLPQPPLPLPTDKTEYDYIEMAPGIVDGEKKLTEAHCDKYKDFQKNPPAVYCEPKARHKESLPDNQLYDFPQSLELNEHSYFQPHDRESEFHHNPHPTQTHHSKYQELQATDPPGTYQKPQNLLKEPLYPHIQSQQLDEYSKSQQHIQETVAIQPQAPVNIYTPVLPKGNTFTRKISGDNPVAGQPQKQIKMPLLPRHGLGQGTGNLNDFTPEQLNLIIDLLQRVVESQYGNLRPPSPQLQPPQDSTCLYDDVLGSSSKYINIGGATDGTYATIDNDCVESVPASTLPPAVPPAVPPKPSVFTRTKQKLEMLEMPAASSTTTGSSKSQTIRSLLRQSIEKRSALSMLVVPEDDALSDNTQRRRLHSTGQRPNWAKAKLNTTPEIEGTVSPDLKTLYIPESHIFDLKLIAQGEFGKVFWGKMRVMTGELIEVAVKTLKKCENELELRNFEREMAISADPQMKHPNIVQVYGIVKEDYRIVMEYLSLGDLKTFLMKNMRATPKLIKYMLDIALGMVFLSEKGLIHRDLAARNILMGSGEICKVSDFGLLRTIPTDEEYYIQSTSAKWPLRWMAPESLAEKRFSFASDVWSYGILSWEIFNPAAIPFEEYDNIQVVTKITAMILPEIPSHVPNDINRVMRSCWRQDPSKRPSFMLLVKALTEINFNSSFCT